VQPLYRVGTRASKLARLQTQIVVDRLKAKIPDVQLEEVAVTTGGDKIVDRPIAELGFRGVFVKELEDALLRGEVDFVVHSLKDVPTDVPDGLCIAAVLDREDPRDILATKTGKAFKDLPPNAVVATSSRRRAAQLKELRSDISFIDIRGNIETRLRKLDEGYCDGTLLAHAGLLRLGLLDRISQVFEPEELTPAAGQGALAIECRANDADLLEMLEKISDKKVSQEIECERSFLAQLGGGCSVPIGALARVNGDNITLTGCIAALDGSAVFRTTHSGLAEQAKEVGKQLAFKMMENGARSTIEDLRLSIPNKISPP
jgi:hydroxymethylbilane synthase